MTSLSMSAMAATCIRHVFIICLLWFISFCLICVVQFQQRQFFANIHIFISIFFIDLAMRPYLFANIPKLNDMDINICMRKTVSDVFRQTNQTKQ